MTTMMKRMVPRVVGVVCVGGEQLLSGKQMQSMPPQTRLRQVLPVDDDDIA